MKHFVLFATALAVSSVSALNLHSEFITGFESGIFMRDNDGIYEEYGCPKAKPPTAFGNIN